MYTSINHSTIRPNRRWILDYEGRIVYPIDAESVLNIRKQCNTVNNIFYKKKGCLWYNNVLPISDEGNVRYLQHFDGNKSNLNIVHTPRILDKMIGEENMDNSLCHKVETNYSQQDFQMEDNFIEKSSDAVQLGSLDDDPNWVPQTEEEKAAYETLVKNMNTVSTFYTTEIARLKDMDPTEIGKTPLPTIQL